MPALLVFVLHGTRLPRNTNGNYRKKRKNHGNHRSVKQESQVCWALPGFGDSLTGTFRVATEGEKELMSKWQNQISHQIEFVK